MSTPASKVAFALAGVLAVAAVGALLLPDPSVPGERHQVATQALTVTVTGTPPTAVHVRANYPVDVGAGTVAQLGGPLLDISASGVGPGGSVTLRAYPPGQSVAPDPITIPGGILLVSGDASSQLTVTVSTPSGTALGPPKQVASVTIKPAEDRIDLRADVNPSTYLRLSFARFWSVQYDANGDAIDVAVVNPLSTVNGRINGVPVAPPNLGPTWLHGHWEGSLFSLDLLRTGNPFVDGKVPGHLEVATDAVQGDPLGSGMVVRAQGKDQVTLQLSQAPKAVHVHVGGELLDKALDGPLDLTVWHEGLLPWDSLLEVYYGNEVDRTLAAQILQPATMRPVFEAAQDPQGATVTLPTASKTITLPGATLSVDSAGRIEAHQGGAKVLGAVVQTGAPPATQPAVVLSGSALSSNGLGDPTTITPNFLAGTVTTTVTNGQSTAMATLGDLVGNTLLETEAQPDGVRVRIGATKGVVADGRIVLGGDPPVPGEVRLRVLDGAGATALDARAERLSATGASPNSLPVITVSAAGQPPIVLASPLQLEGPAGSWSAVRVLNPVNPSSAVIEYRSEAGLFVMGSKVADPAGPVTVPGGPPGGVPGGAPTDVLSGPAVTLNAGPATIRIDRSTTPPTATVSGLPGPPSGLPITVSPPLVVTGEPTAPSGVAVYDPRNMAGPPLLAWRSNADGTSTVTLPDGSSQTVGGNAVTSEGLPLASPVWRLTVRVPGAAPQTFAVDRAAVQGPLAANGVDLRPFITILQGQAPSVDFYKVATDGVRSLGPANLTGSHWLNGNGAVNVRVDVPKDKDIYAPTLLYAVGQVPQRGTSPSVAMQRTGATADFVSYRAAIPSSWLAAQTDTRIAFALAFDLNAAGGLVSQSFLDDANGAGYRFLADHVAPAPGTAQAARDPDRTNVLRVSWSATDTGGSGVASYDVQKRQGTGPWEPWIDRGTVTSAEFTGTRGMSYGFRVRGVDHVGNVGLWGNEVTQSLPPPPAPPTPPVNPPGGNPPPDQGGDENHAPTIRLLQPLGGEAFAKVPTIEVRWTAADTDGTTPTVTVAASGDGGTTWEALTTTTESAYTWDVSRLGGTEWRIRVTANDGSLSTSDLSSRFTIDNSALATAETIGGPNQQASPGTDTGAAPGGAPSGGAGAGAAAAAGDMTLLLGVAVGVIALAGAVVWLQRYRR